MFLYFVKVSFIHLFIHFLNVTWTLILFVILNPSKKGIDSLNFLTKRKVFQSAHLQQNIYCTKGKT